MVTDTTTEGSAPIETHDGIARDLLAAADAILNGPADEINGERRVQASEKIWGAAVHMLSEIAGARGWPEWSHNDSRDIARYVAALTDNRRVRQLFGQAEAAHRNFYRDELPPDAIRELHDDVLELAELLEAAHDTLDLELEPPSYAGYRERHDLDNGAIEPELRRRRDDLRRKVQAARRNLDAERECAGLEAALDFWDAPDQ